MRIAILGAGFVGLTAAYQLSKQHHNITVFEKETYPGGLASGFKEPNWVWPLERAYHHLFTSDLHAKHLMEEIGIGHKLFFQRPVTASLYSNGQNEINIYQLDSPLSLMKFPKLPLSGRLRTGMAMAYLRFTPFWKDFEKTTAQEWISYFMGHDAWKVLWQPLLEGKFHQYSNQVNMAWFWARIKKRSTALGYIEGGFQHFAEALAKQCQDNGVNIQYNTTVTNIQPKNKGWQISDGTTNQQFDQVLCTVPTPILARILPQLPKPFMDTLQSIPHLHALNLVLELSQPFFSTINKSGQKPYWVNIMNPSWPFLALVEHTNFIAPEHYGNSHILYAGNYLPMDHPYFNMKDTDLFNEMMPYLRRINPQIEQKRSMIKKFHVFTGPFAQPVMEINYSRKKPSMATPLRNVFLANLDSVYPWDRGTNYAIELGQTVAKLMQT